MKYKIKIEYQTGDSFHHEDAIDYLDYEWENIDVAKENLKRIEEHYKMHCATNAFSNYDSQDEIIEKYKDKIWFVKRTYISHIKKNYCVDKSNNDYILHPEKYVIKIDLDHATQYIMLLTDKRTEFQESCFWCGYFESLYLAEIVPELNDMKYEVN